MNIVVLDGYSLNPGDLSWTELQRFGSLKIHDRTPIELVVERLRSAELALTTKTPLKAATLRQLPNLRYIGVLATGYDIVDVAAAREARITVTNIPEYGTASVAQLAFALLLELCHRTGLHDDGVRSGEWTRCPDWSFWKAPLVELAGKTMGIVGFGRIGRQTAAIATAFGMRVTVHSPTLRNSPAYKGFQWLSLDELMTVADVVSLHCPLTAQTVGIIDRERLERMKATAFLINTARGRLIVEQDLADALNQDMIAGAGLDVLSTEPPPATNPLLVSRNCVITPHIAWGTQEARRRLLNLGIENVRAFLKGRPQNLI